MDEIKKLISEIDLLMTHISSDTNKTKLPQLNAKLIELSKIYAENKIEVVRKKNAYDREFIMKKEERKQELERLENNKLEEDPKYKKQRITNVDIEQYTELELMTMKKEQEENNMIVVYLDIILKSYFERVQSVKFQSNLENKFNSYRNDNE